MNEETTIPDPTDTHPSELGGFLVADPTTPYRVAPTAPVRLRHTAISRLIPHRGRGRLAITGLLWNNARSSELVIAADVPIHIFQLVRAAIAPNQLYSAIHSGMPVAHVAKAMGILAMRAPVGAALRTARWSTTALRQNLVHGVEP
jgi:hypothetical protein